MDTSDAPTPPQAVFAPFSTPEGEKNEKQDKQPTSNPVLFFSHLPAVRAV